MNYRHIQAPTSAVMIRPHRFTVNPQTAADNAFQTVATDLPDEEVSRRALAEFDEAVALLRDHGVRIHVFDDFGDRETPDSVFPNNWFSTHHGGRVALFPMYSRNRRRERRADVIEMLKHTYRVQEVIDYSGLEQDELFLEGTGSMVFDHYERLAYVSNSNRADPIVLERFCTAFGYEPMVFDTADRKGNAIYHTNVMMSIGTDYALVCLEAITDAGRRNEIAKRLINSGRELIDLRFGQVEEFAGNAFEMTGKQGRVLALSTKAFNVLGDVQRELIAKSAQLLPLDIPTIELAGGSVRCMIAGIHLTKR